MHRFCLSTKNSCASACAMPMDSTESDIAVREWALDDRVMHLREWGTDTIHVLPPPPEVGLANLTVGSATTCTLQLHDSTGHISRLHASLVQSDPVRWQLHDLGSKNGIRLDGARCSRVELAAGDEIGIGSLTLIAESRRSVELREFFARLLGWRSEHIQVVDLALHAIHMAAPRRSALVLRGDGDLVPIARAIHRRAFGADRPFIVADPRRRRGK